MDNVNLLPPKPKPAWLSIWKWYDVLAMILFTFFLTIMGTTLILVWEYGLDYFLNGSPEAIPELTLTFALGTVAVWVIALLVSVLGIGSIRRVDWTLLGLRPTSTSWWLGSATIGLLCVPLAGAVAQLVRTTLLGSDAINPQLDVIVPDGFSWTGMLGMLLLVGLLTPLGEELFFRGVLHRWLRGKMAFVWAAALSSAIFGAVHGEISIAIGAALIGGLCAWTYEHSGSLWPAIVIHAVNNSVGVVLAYVAILYGLA